MDYTYQNPPADLYPSISPHQTGMLPVSEGHKIYWEVSGNPDGIPALFLHGGPGAAALAIHRRFFDPAAYRIILLHQRGCGRSVPHATVEANTTDHLIADIEELRRHLDVEKWMVFGGSWGSTLALAYGIAFPDRCLGFILRGIFLCRPEEISWFMGGIARVFPDAWRDFEAAIPADERGDLLDAYRRRLLSPDPAVHGPAAAAWAGFETRCSVLISKSYGVADASDSTLALARLEAHYIFNGCFLPKTTAQQGYLLAHMERLGHLPATIIQGRYDMICPAGTAYDLARAWPNADLKIIPAAGHSALEEGIRRALVAATDDMAVRILRG